MQDKVQIHVDMRHVTKTQNVSQRNMRTRSSTKLVSSSGQPLTVSGTEYVEGSFPIGIKVVTKRYDICQAIRNDLGNMGKEFISKSTAMCACGPKALQLMANGFFKSVQSGTDTSAAVMQLAKDLAKASKVRLNTCFPLAHDLHR